ncbi:glycoprotein precursor [Japanese star anise ringspot-associated virus]|uniref:Glycoprotein n=1 Tax=Japanese star anise ringspot-associated virus TaxID=2798807 RepID=A0A8J9WF50_9VIRU|nr:glycoprotein precursor [Japanese star anise ringspot-associated virus]BCO17109.1 glycoprotein precursor [Japanese star anise ringspot-associated virus]
MNMVIDKFYTIFFIFFILQIIDMMILKEMKDDSKIGVIREKREFDCESYFVLDNEIQLCFKDDSIKLIYSDEMTLVKENCFITENDIFSFVCNGERMTKVKPVNQTCFVNSHTLCKNFFYLRRIFYFVLIHIVMRILKEPFLILTHFTLNLFSKNECQKCKSKYIFSHSSCCDKNTHKSSENLVLYYILIIIVSISLFFNPAMASPVRYEETMYKKYNGLTELKVLDKENIVQKIEQGLDDIKITVLSSLIEYKLEYSHDVGSIDSSMIADHDYFCVDRVNSCRNKYKSNVVEGNYFQFQKPHDKMVCPFSTAMVCGYCESKVKKLGEIYRLTDIKPKIEFLVETHNNTIFIRIDKSGFDFSNEILTIEKVELNPVESTDLYFIKDNKVYTGQICNSPDDNCFGDIIIQDGKTIARYEPQVIDDPETGLGIFLKQCIKSNEFNYNNLKLTKISKISLNNSFEFLADYNFGHFNFYFNGSYFLTDMECMTKKKVIDIAVSGCYDCQSGYSVRVKVSEKNCGTVVCNFDGVTRKFYIKNSDKVLHEFTVHETIIINCNGYQKIVKLTKDNSYHDFQIHEYGHYDQDANTIDAIKNIVSFSLPNFKLLFSLIFLFLIAVFGVLHELKQFKQHSNRLIKLRKDGYIITEADEHSLVMRPHQ